MRKIIYISIVSASVGFGLSCRKEETRTDSETITAVREVKKTGLYIGLVGFSNTVTVVGLTEDADLVSSSLNSLSNTNAATALCYGISKGVDQLKSLSNNQALDQAFVVAFTDGYDNVSSSLFVNDGVQVTQPGVVKYTSDLLNSTLISGKKVRCYTLGYTDVGGSIKASELSALAVNGSYTTAASSNLNATFENIANSLISTSKNVAFYTNLGIFTDSNPKFYQIQVNAQDSLSNTVTGIIEGTYSNSKGNNPKFVTTNKNSKLSFVGDNGNPIFGTIEARNNVNKAIIPLSNLTFLGANGKPMIINTITIKFMATAGDPFTEDPEDSQSEQSISKNIGVVLVLDCSSSISDFNAVRQGANQFIQKLVVAKK